jgi:hypothetical protein
VGCKLVRMRGRSPALTRRRCGFPAVLVFGFVACAVQAANPASEAPILDAVAAANGRNADGIRTVVVEQTVSERYKERPGEQEESRERLARWAETQNRLEAAHVQTAPAEIRDRVQQKGAQRLASVDASSRVSQLNKNVKVARNRARYDDRDLRDLDRLAAENGLGPERMVDLTRSGSQILRVDRSATLKPEAGLLALVLPQPRFDLRGERLSLGIIPSGVFDGALHLEVLRRGTNSMPEIEVVGRDSQSGHAKVRFAVRPDYGLRLVRWTVYDPDENVVEDFRASDFRRIHGVFIPFRTELRRSAYGVPDYYVRETVVQSARVNVPLTDDFFEIPAAYRVQNIITGDPIYTKRAKPSASVGGTLPLKRPHPWEMRIELPGSRPATEPATQPTLWSGSP